MKKINVLVIVSFNAQKTPAPLVVCCHGDLVEKCLDLVPVDSQALEDMIRPLLHNILGTGAGCHAGHLSTDTLSNDGIPERSPRDSACVHLDDFIADCAAHRGFALYHVFTTHEDFRPVGILMTVQQFSRNNTAQFFNLVYITVDSLLEDFINHLKVPG